VQECREALVRDPDFAVDLIVRLAERDDLVLVPEPYCFAFEFGQSFPDVLREAGGGEEDAAFGFFLRDDFGEALDDLVAGS
jgi:hypothetical protein